jgi:branched-chain amino acid transport system substrate-binding protein
MNFNVSGMSFAVGPSIPQFVQAVGPLAANLFGPAQWIPQLPALGYDRFGTASNFAADYYQRYNLDASYLSAGAVASGLTFEDAIKRAGSIDRLKVRDAIAATQLYTFYGLIQFNSQGINANKPLVTFQLQQCPIGLTNIILNPKDLVAQGATAVWPFPGWNKPGWPKQQTAIASA